MGIFCRSSLNYATGDGPVPTEVEIRDARSADLPGWQECGFELIEHPSAVEDWDDEEHVAAVHHPEVEEIARQMTGLDVALVSGHIRRNPDSARRHQQLAPITFVHSDFAISYDELIRNSYLEGKPWQLAALGRNGVTAEQVIGARQLVILQFWRNVGPAKMDFPLGFCDARTMTVADGIPLHVEDYAGTGVTFDALAIRRPEDPADHEWYAFPEMQPHEAVAFRTYDTDLVSDGKVWFTPHSAFADPEVPAGQPARSSIELRATCIVP